MNKLTENISQDRLKELMSYDKDDGFLTWNKNVNSRARAGGVAGSINGEGYREVRIDGVTRRAARLVFFYMTGRWPEQVDHIDGNRSNDAWINLREVDTKENARNRRISSSNTSGTTGVQLRGFKWIASITVDGKNIHLGRFDNEEDAIEERKAAEIVYGFHPNHGDK